MKQDLCALLRGNPYPGRGIVLGRTADGKQSVAVYFIMGRSANSRNRIFAEEPDGIRTQAADPAKMVLSRDGRLRQQPHRDAPSLDAVHLVRLALSELFHRHCGRRVCGAEAQGRCQ